MDFPDDQEMFDYGDDFEDKYADDLDALNALEENVESPIPAAKKRLDFQLSPLKTRILQGESEKLTIHENTLKRGRVDDDNNTYLEDDYDLRRSHPESKKQKRQTDTNHIDTVLSTHLEAESPLINRKPPVNTLHSNSIRSKFVKTALYDQISFTTFDGDIFHLQLRNDVDMASACLVQRRTSFFPQTYNELRIEALKLIEQKCTKLEEHKENINITPSDIVEHQSALWVEKFKPNDFLDLLSDDGINRALLSWLKLWDRVVFGKEATKKPKKENEPNNFGKPKFQEVIKDLDELNRPKQIIALLCGPPGFGKTTLAYTLAKQAGYNVVEMNASDDRSPDVFKRQLEASTQMRAVMGQAPRPNCLIIDEIDGAPAPAINALVAFAKNTKKSTLLRPVICICNDLYTPALRPLRQMSLVLMFPPTCPARLVSRLLEISRVQKIKTDRGALAALCQKAENDIRSCLSTIQFLHGLKGELRTRDVRTVNVGQKDSQVSIFTVWQNIFQAPRPQKKQTFHVQNEITASNRFFKILHLIQSCGEYEKVVQGLFENYLNINYRDPQFHRTVLGADWLCFASDLQNVISHLQNYSIMPYLPYAILSFHFLFSINSNVKITNPTAQFDFKTNLTRRENIVTAMLQDMSPMARSSLNVREVVMNFLPSLVLLVQPSLRPVNTQLYSAREKMELRHCIDTMVAYNLHYRQERNTEGLYNYVLEPNVEDVIAFPGLKVQNSLTYGAKQLIAREIEVERMRRNERPSEHTTKPASEPKKPVIPNHQQVLKPKKDVVEVVEAKDFFGRKVSQVGNKQASNAGVGHIWFRFKEGYTNAARKTLYMKDLL